MRYKKISCTSGWIVFIVDGNKVIEVHSTGKTFSGSDDRGYPEHESRLLKMLEHDAYNNDLHSQLFGRCGVRWPEEE
jgi:hypothetical protein